MTLINECGFRFEIGKLLLCVGTGGNGIWIQRRNPAAPLPGVIDFADRLVVALPTAARRWRNYLRRFRNGHRLQGRCRIIARLHPLNWSANRFPGLLHQHSQCHNTTENGCYLAPCREVGHSGFKFSLGSDASPDRPRQAGRDRPRPSKAIRARGSYCTWSRTPSLSGYSKTTRSMSLRFGAGGPGPVVRHLVVGSALSRSAVSAVLGHRIVWGHRNSETDTDPVSSLLDRPGHARRRRAVSGSHSPACFRWIGDCPGLQALQRGPRPGSGGEGT